MGRSSVFSLEQIYRKQVVGTWSKMPETFRYVNSLAVPEVPGGPAYGYWAGGSGSQTVTRLDFGNDTAAQAPKGPLAQTAYSYGGTASSSYAYFYGGQMAGSRIQRIDFADDTSTALLKGPLSAAAGYQGTVGNDSYGYSVAGGGSVPMTSNVDRLDYANDTATASPKGKASEARQGVMGGAGNNNYGYIGGGVVHPGSNFKTTMDRIDYANDTATMAAKGPLSGSGKYYMGAAGNSSYGYFGTGYGPSDSRADRLDYSSDTTQASLKGPLSSGKGFYGATGSGSFGYYGGGGPSGPGSTVDRIDYSNDTASYTAMSNLPNSYMKLTAASAQDNGQQRPATPIVPATRTEAYPRSAGLDFGYVGMGFGGNRLSTVNRIDFSNDTSAASVKGSLTVARNTGSGVSGESYGYFAGGYTGGSPATGDISRVDRIDYSNDTPTASITGNLSDGRAGGGSVGNVNYGYIAGGRTASTADVSSKIDRIDYSNDSATATPKGNIPDGGWFYHGGTGNQSYGYLGGRRYPASSGYSYITRIDFANDTAITSPKGNLGSPKYDTAATGNVDFGYWSGGNESSVIDRLDFSNDTANTVEKGNISSTPASDIGRYGASAFSSSSHGYFAGGRYPATNFSTVDRIDYSNDTATAVVVGSLSYSAYNGAGLSPTPVPSTVSQTVDKGSDGYTTTASGPAFGYWIAGDGGGSRYHRVDFSNDTGTAGVRGNLDRSMSRNASVSSLNYSYTVGGSSNTNISRIDYADDTATATPKGNLPPINGLSSSAGIDTINYGYICGGLPLTTVNRIDFSNDTAVASAKGPLTATRRYISATGNSSYGYVIAGTPPSMSSVDRIDYSNDTATATVKGNIAYKVEGNGATGNADYGYVTGGFNTVPGSNNWMSSTTRIDYSNDTATSSPKGPLTQIRKTKSTGSTSYGWSGGGSTSGHAGTSTMDRIDYANDTATASARGSLSGTRTNHYAAGGQANAKQGTPTFIPRIRWVDSASQVPAPSVGPAFAYFGGGSPGPLSSTERLDYNNDTATAVTKGPLSSAKYGAASTGSTTHGYWGAGSPHPGLSTVDRIDYSNDTGAASVRGPLNQSTYMQGAMSSLTHGYWVGGVDMPSRVNRVDFSNDTVTAPQVGNLDHPNYAYNPGAAGNTTHGYVIGGTNAATSKVTRIDFSNDTATPSPVGNLSAKNTSFGTAGNANFAYTGGGEPGVYTSIVNRIEYANDTATALVKGPLTSVKTRVTASGNANFGYWVGGATPTVLTTIDRIDYANDTVTATPKGNLGTPRRFMGTAGASAKANAYPQEAVAAPVQPPFSFPVQLPSYGPAMGYVLGGSAPAGVTTVDRIDYSSDTSTASVKGSMTVATRYHSAAGSKTHGYAFGGNTPATSPGFGTSKVERVDYANDTAALALKGSLLRTIYRSYAGVGNETHGYYSGGQGQNSGSPSSAATTYVDRIEYANDTSSGVQKGNLASARYLHSASGNKTYGYVQGGSPSFQNNTLVQRMEFANDTTTHTPKGPLSHGCRKLTATGNLNYGYVAGGTNAATSRIERIDYGNDTATASPKGPMTVVRSSLSSLSALEYGYITGGSLDNSGLARTSQIDRMEYANDTTTALVKGPLSAARGYNGGVSSRDAGAL